MPDPVIIQEYEQRLIAASNAADQDAIDSIQKEYDTERKKRDKSSSSRSSSPAPKTTPKTTPKTANGGSEKGGK